MSTTVNKGGQIVTFDFRQDGTSQSFNRLNYRLLPKGILYDTNATDILERFTDTEITIHPFRAVLRDDTNEVAINFYMTEDATVSASPANPYIVGEWSWLNIEDCYMEFKAVQFENIDPTKDIIIGKCLYENAVLTGFDNSRRTYSKDFYEQINTDTPPFLVHSTELSEGTTNTVRIGKGSAIIGGKRVTFTQEVSSPTINLNITNGKKILVSINSSGEVVLTSSEDEASPVAPAFPSNMLTVAILTLGSNPTAITGANIEYIYTNNFVQVETPSQQTIDNLSGRITAIENGKGQPNGYASLGADGKVLASQLPDSIGDLVETPSQQTIDNLSGRITAIENGKGQPNGYASLGADGKVLASQLPDSIGDLIVTNVQVAVADWQSDATYSDFDYKAEISVVGATPDYSPDVRFAYAEIQSGIYAPVADTDTNKVIIYANAIPASAITIPVIICTLVSA